MKYSESGNKIGIDMHDILRALGIGMAFAVLSCTLVLLLAAVIMSSSDVPEGYAAIAADTAVIVSSLAAGTAAAKVLKMRGLMVGIVMGAVYYAVLMIVGLIFFNTELTAAAATRLIMIVISSAIGGVLGVNVRIKKKWK